MLPGDSQDVERREVSCFASRFHIEFCADASNEFRAPSFCGEHPGKKKQIARLHRFHINAERLRSRRKLAVKFFELLVVAGGARACGCCDLTYDLPTCAPPLRYRMSPLSLAAPVGFVPAL